MLTYSDINLSVNIRKSMVKVIKLMIRKSKKTGKKYYRIAIPIANEIFEKASFNENNEFKLSARKGSITIAKKINFKKADKTSNEEFIQL